MMSVQKSVHSPCCPYGSPKHPYPVLLLIFAALVTMTAPVALARAGQGRSMGRPSGASSFRSNNRMMRPSAPPTTPVSPGPSSYSARPTPRTEPMAAARPESNLPPPSQGRSSFLKNMAGAAAGGFLGSMLFSGISNAFNRPVSGGLGGPVDGGMTGAGVPSTGGVGIMEVILMAGLAFLAYRWWKSRQESHAKSLAFGGADIPYIKGSFADKFSSSPTYDEPSLTAGEPSQIEQEALTKDSISTDQASDIFFRIQAAWTRRDMSPVHHIMSLEVQEKLAQDVAKLKSEGAINRLENISIRHVRVLRTWREQDKILCAVDFAANMLDYTVDQVTGQLRCGSQTDPIRFNEIWTFEGTEQTIGQWRWILAGIEQVDDQG